jgi:hypothetical protein
VRSGAYTGAIGGEVDLGASWIHGALPANPLVGLRDRQNITTLPTNWDDTRLYEEGTLYTPAESQAVATDVASVFTAVKTARDAWNTDRDLAMALAEADTSGLLTQYGGSQW